MDIVLITMAIFFLMIAIRSTLKRKVDKKEERNPSNKLTRYYRSEESGS